jgi:uncharacterized membrane protein
MIRLLFSTARSGSTWRGHVLAQQYNCEFLNEPFRRETLSRHKHILINTLKNYSSKENSCVIKVFPNHLQVNQVRDLERILIDTAVDAEILVRRDFLSQLKSIYVAIEHSKIVDPTASSTHPWQRNFDEPMVIEKIDHSVINEIYSSLTEQIMHLRDIYQQHGFTVTYLEDICDNYDHMQLPVGKLHRPLVWKEQFPNMQFNTEELFR